MPLMLPGTLECSVYLYRSQKDAKAGVGSGGSGFLVEMPSVSYPDDITHIYAVTASHVIERGYTVVRFNTKDGATDFHDVGKSAWTPHQDGDDVAVSKILTTYTDQFDIAPVSIDKFLPALCYGLARDGFYSVTPGREVYMVGRFINHDGTQRNSPSVRFGHIAMMADANDKVRQPQRKINGEVRDFDQESFLVDILSIGGYSGSPVFVYFPHDSKTDEGFTEFLLGVLWGTVPEYKPILDQNNKELLAGWRVESDTSMAGVVPAWRLRNLLENHEDLKSQRKEEDRIINEKRKTQAQRPAGILHPKSE